MDVDQAVVINVPYLGVCQWRLDEFLILLSEAHFALAIGRTFQKHHRDNVQRFILADPAKEKCMKLAFHRSARKAKELLESMCQKYTDRRYY